MGIFSRIRDIINSNVNAMLDKAEEPEKLVKLMISEMEDSLVEIRSSAAHAVASQRRIERELAAAEQRLANWQSKAELALEKKREDLAREALIEKRRWAEQADALRVELDYFVGLNGEYKDDIVKLEKKLDDVRKRQRILIQRHSRAKEQKIARERMRKVDTSNVFDRVDSFENRVDRLEAESDLASYGVRTPLEEKFRQLEGEDEIDAELNALKKSIKKNIIVEKDEKKSK